MNIPGTRKTKMKTRMGKTRSMGDRLGSKGKITGHEYGDNKNNPTKTKGITRGNETQMNRIKAGQIINKAGK